MAERFGHRVIGNWCPPRWAQQAVGTRWLWGLWGLQATIVAHTLYGLCLWLGQPWGGVTSPCPPPRPTHGAGHSLWMCSLTADTIRLQGAGMGRSLQQAQLWGTARESKARVCSESAGSLQVWVILARQRARRGDAGTDFQPSSFPAHKRRTRGHTVPPAGGSGDSSALWAAGRQGRARL